MDDLLLLYPDRESFPHHMGKLLDILEYAFGMIRSLREEVATLKHAHFGQKSEQAKKTETSEKDKKTKKPCNRNKDNYKHHGRNPFPEDLPKEETVYDLKPEEKCCPCCQSFLTKIGKVVTKQLDLVPQTIIVREHTRLKYACRKCGQTIKLASMPGQPIEKGSIGPALLAQIITEKHQDGLPLYRIQRKLKRQGVEISRATLSGWMRQAADTLEPIYEKMAEEVIVGNLVFSDDTRMPMLDPGSGKTKTGYIWVHGRKKMGEQGAITVYEFTLGRHGKYPQEFLKDLVGVVQADRYAGYEKLFELDEDGKSYCRLAACWAHVRRKFFDAVKIDAKSVAQEMIAMIGELYAVEKYATKEKMSDETRFLYRLEKSVSILEKIQNWLTEHAPKVPPKSVLGQAIQYALNAWEPLQTFLEDGHIDIDNNRAERAIRVVVIGRNNWLFVGSARGGKTAAILLSLVETCKQNDIDSVAYLTDVLKKIPDASFSHKRIDELLPHNWRPPQKKVDTAAA